MDGAYPTLHYEMNENSYFPNGYFPSIPRRLI